MARGSLCFRFFKLGVLIFLSAMLGNVFADNIIQQNEPLDAYRASDVNSFLFNYPYIGGGISLAGVAHKGSYNNLVLDDSYYSGENSVGGSAFLGIGSLFGQVYLGGELFYQYLPFDVLDHDFIDGWNNNRFEILNVKATSSYGANIHLGGITSSGTLIYALFGGDFTHFKMQTKYHYPAQTITNSFGKSVGGIMPGVGIEVALAHGFSLREQYTMSFYASIAHSVGGYIPTERVSVNDLMNGVFSLALLYHLPIYNLQNSNAALPALNSASAVIFNRPYVGLGINSGALTNKGQLTFPMEVQTWKFMSRKNSFGGNLVAGYGTNLFSKVYGGVEAFANYMPFNAKDATLTANGESYTHQLTNDYSFGGDLRLGYFLTANTLGYVLFGGDVSEFTIKDRFDASPVSIFKCNITKPGYLGGIGIETALGSSWALRAQYSSAYYPKITKKGVIAGENVDFKFKNIVKSAFTIGVDYYLG